MQFGSGYGAQTVLMPTEAQENYDRSQILHQQSQLATATLPNEIAMSGDKAASSALALANMKTSSLAQNTATGHQLIADVLERSHNVEEADPELQDLVDKGIPGASQFIGRFSLARRDDWVRGLRGGGGQSGLAAAGGATSPLAGTVGGPASPITAQAAQIPDEKLHEIAQQVAPYAAAIQAIRNSPNPEQEWARQAVLLGHPETIGDYQNGEGLARLEATITPFANILQQRGLQASLGLPKAVPPADLTKATPGESIFTIDRSDPAHPQLKLLGTAPAAPIPGMAGFGGAPGTGAGITPEQWAQKMTAAENATGNPNAKNPRSSATGDGQFVDKTWLKTIKTERPDLAAGKTDGQILAMRSDPALSAQMIAALGVENGVQLAAAKQPVNATTLAMAHRFGVDGAEKILAAAPGTALDKLLSPQAMKANPDLAGKTAGGITATLAARFGMDPVQIAGASGLSATGATVSDMMRGGAAGDEIHGPDYLKTLAPNIATQVQALADGRMQFPSGFALTKPFWQQMIAAVGQYDPTFNQSDYNARAKTRAQFTSGAQAKNVTSYNTAIGHLEQMDKSIDELGNTPFEWWNKAAQWVGRQTGDPHTQAAVADFTAAKGALASELTTAFRGSSGAVADVDYWQKQLDQAESPTALRQTVRRAAGLLSSRIDALNESYNTGMGTSNQTAPGLSPRAAVALAKLQGLQAPAAAGGAHTPPQVGQVVRGFRYNGGDPASPQSWQKAG